MKQTVFNNYKYILHIKQNTLALIKQSMKLMDITAVTKYLNIRKIKMLIQAITHPVNTLETSLDTV